LCGFPESVSRGIVCLRGAVIYLCYCVARAREPAANRKCMYIRVPVPIIGCFVPSSFLHVPFPPSHSSTRLTDHTMSIILTRITGPLARGNVLSMCARTARLGGVIGTTGLFGAHVLSKPAFVVTQCQGPIYPLIGG